MPPCSRNHRVPTAGDTPAVLAASSLEQPKAIAFQNGRPTDRCKTGGRPGYLNLARHSHPPLVIIANSNIEA